MTRLLNLESYTDFCCYTQIFGELSLSRDSGIPLDYKAFLTKYRDSPFLPSPILLNNFPASPVSRYRELIPYTVGIELDDKQTDDLVIVRDIDVLSLRSLDCRYLYNSAYRYWNFVSQLKNIAQTGKPLVIYDLDSLPAPNYLPISFEQHPNCSHLIPILDTRTVENYDGLKLPFKNPNIYDSICQRISQQIVATSGGFKLKISTIAEYLKRINIFEILQAHLNHNPATESLSILVKIPQDNSQFIYLPITLEVQTIEKIVIETVPIETLKSIPQEHPQYHFVLLSQYNCFSSFRSRLEPYFFLPDTSCTEFINIWQQKLSQNFPLYGQYLDLITFELADNIKIDVPEQNETQAIYYEGEAHNRTFIGKYRTVQKEIKSSFSMDKYQVNLPIKINRKPLIENGKEQVYFITNNFFTEDSKVSVEIHFLLSLGKPLGLDVIDSKGRKLESKLGDRPEAAPLEFIPIQNILEDRKRKEDNAISNLKLRPEFLNSFRKGLDETINVLDRYINNFHKPLLIKDLNSLHDVIRNSYMTLLQNDSLRYISPDDNLEISQEIKEIIKSRKLADYLQKFLPILDKKFEETKGEIKNKLSKIYNYTILLVGKEYKFVGTQDFYFLYDCLNSSLQIGEYIKVLARISSQENFQRRYFQLFFNSIRSNSNQNFYQNDHYMWGYARILLWYLEFQIADTFVLYKCHFRAIIQYSLSNESKESYYQSALIALIYLLTFRELDPGFCLAGSYEYNVGKQLCEQLPQINSKQISSEKSLNKIFEEFLDGVASNEQIINMLKVE